MNSTTYADSYKHENVCGSDPDNLWPNAKFAQYDDIEFGECYRPDALCLTCEDPITYMNMGWEDPRFCARCCAWRDLHFAHVNRRLQHFPSPEKHLKFELYSRRRPELTEYIEADGVLAYHAPCGKSIAKCDCFDIPNEQPSWLDRMVEQSSDKVARSAPAITRRYGRRSYAFS